jgi:sRNA-binding protein
MNPERKRGYQEAAAQFEALRARWPKAFPARSSEVRPLELSAVDAVASEMGWSRDYARAVLSVWKQRMAYCRAVLTYPTRFGLDGSKTDEAVDEIARAHASASIARIESRKLAREARDASSQTLTSR